MSRPALPARISVLAVGAALAVVVAGCSGAESGPDPIPTTAISSGVCEDNLSVQPDPKAKLLAVIVDDTASQRSAGLPPAVGEALTAAQHNGWNLLIVGVNGGGDYPVSSRRFALDPTNGDDSPNSRAIQSATLGCLVQELRSAAYRPKTAGSDLVAALAEAAKQKPAQIAVISDGLSDTGALDLNKVGFGGAPSDVVKTLHDAGQLPIPGLAGIPLTWTELGQSSTPLAASLLLNLRALWTAVLTDSQATVTFDDRTETDAAPAAGGPLLADPLAIPEPKTTETPQLKIVTLPGAMLFLSDRTDILPGAAATINSAVPDLLAHPAWTVLVVGHTAAYRVVSDAQLHKFSLDRAESVKAFLVSAGVEAGRITTKGVGADEPATPNTDDANRRVEIIITKTGS